MRRLLVLIVLAAALISYRGDSVTRACAIAFRDNEPARFADQAVIIVWDAANKVEHFIRKAAFQSESKDFGFLVPTPTQPTLAEAKDSAFDALEKITARQTKWQWSGSPLLCAIMPTFRMSATLNSSLSQSGVRVLHAQRVAGFDAAVLEADDASALAAWLKAHGYSFRPELTSWLEHYVAKKWKVTAFKVAHDPQTGLPATTAAVRMSFATDQPFFPYRVPDEADPQRRLLRIFMLSDQRVRGDIRDSNSWPARTVWADRLTKPQLAALRTDLGLAETAMPPDAWLTTFDDPVFPNPGKDDVYFSPAPSQETLHRPPIVRTIWTPLDVVLPLGGWIVYRIVRRRRNSTTDHTDGTDKKGPS